MSVHTDSKKYEQFLYVCGVRHKIYTLILQITECQRFFYSATNFEVKLINNDTSFLGPEIVYSGPESLLLVILNARMFSSGYCWINSLKIPTLH